MISRRQMLRNSAVALVASATPSLAAPKAKPAKRPNILFCIADDASWKHFGAYGCNWVKSPGFDRIAKEGLLFRNGYTPNAKCSPSRACVLTGRNSWQLEEACNHQSVFPPKFTSYQEILHKQGYFVGYTGKGYSPAIVKTADGEKRDLLVNAFKEKTAPRPTSGISPCDYAANFAEFLKARPKDKPFCFWYGASEPHRKYQAGSGVNIGKKSIDDIKEVPKFWPDTKRVRSDMLDYALEIEHFDIHLCRILKQIEAAGELDNTLVVVTADNGMPFPRVKGQAYKYANHLPLAIRWPEGIAKPGRVIDDYVSFIDFAPTFLDVAGIQGRGTMQPITGKTLQPIFKAATGGQIDPKRDHVLIGKERHDIGRPKDAGYPIRGIAKGKYLYLRNYEPTRWPIGNPEAGYRNTDASPTKSECLKGRAKEELAKYYAMNFGKRPPEELYRIDTDAECIHNLADDPNLSEIKSQLKAEMEAQLRAEGDPRMFGKGAIFDNYPYGKASRRGYYEACVRRKAKAEANPKAEKKSQKKSKAKPTKKQ